MAFDIFISHILVLFISLMIIDLDDGRSPLEESFSYLWGPLGPFKSRRLCDVNMKDVHERTALHYAAEQGNVDLLKQLLRAGDNVSVKINGRFI